ncbi:MAG TPA: DUF763 domain-containing protein [Syntrophomonadaceae bacterium]|nr:DUF763 domain-containing protein [Syntrophomonadaceae bacterium]
MRTGTADLPLHNGRCPAWLFKHMKALCAAIVEVIIEDSGAETVLERLSNPYWFQALGCVVGFDWHSSGVTTTVCGALKEGMAQLGPAAGLFIAGGKGKAALKTPREIELTAEKFPLAVNAENLVYASKMSAKVDSAAVQDGYQIYHHCFIFTSSGHWAVIQQGMNEDIRQARRYHWLGSRVRDYVNEPQAAICCDTQGSALNLVSEDNVMVRQTACELIQISPAKVITEIEKIRNSVDTLQLPRCHAIPRTQYLNKSLFTAYEQHPQDFEKLLQVSGVGPGTLRALCLVAEVAYGVEASYKDPVRYAFAHGGKDGFPFPVNEADIENSYNVLNRALRRSRAGHNEQIQALKNLARWHNQAVIGTRCTPSYSSSTRLMVPDQKKAEPQPETLQQPSLFSLL